MKRSQRCVSHSLLHNSPGGLQTKKPQGRVLLIGVLCDYSRGQGGAGRPGGDGGDTKADCESTFLQALTCLVIFLFRLPSWCPCSEHCIGAPSPFSALHLALLSFCLTPPLTVFRSAPAPGPRGQHPGRCYGPCLTGEQAEVPRKEAPAQGRSVHRWLSTPDLQFGVFCAL